MMMTELGYVEKPIIVWLSGDPRDPNDHGMGWKYRKANEMAQYQRPVADPLTVGILLPAIMRINPAVQTEAQADMVIEKLRHVMANPDPLQANRDTLEVLRDGIPVVLTPGEPATTVKLIELDPDKINLNDFTVTNQYKVKGTKGCKADTILLVNGIPLVVAEYKSFMTSGKDWKEGVKQLHRYQLEAPSMLVPNVFCVSADEQEFRFGTVAFKIDSDQDVKLQRDHWKPWLSQYPTRRAYWALPDDELDDDPVRAAVAGLLQPCNVIDFLAHFTVFETKKGNTVKKVARYQQFEAANDIVDRVQELYGKDVTQQDRTGLIWHFQGSGKTLTMIFAGYKLRRLSDKLNNATVMIVVDRRDLKTQIGTDFESCDYPGITKAMGVEDLKTKIATDQRGTFITTLQCFQRMDDLKPCLRDNMILLIDEAHRSQQGKAAGYATTMDAKLPNAFRFGLTGTPIDRTLVNTHRRFGPIIDGDQQRYLSYYGIRRAIKDGAILEVHYKRAMVPFEVDEEPLSVGFEQMCDDVEVYDEDEKDYHQRQEVRWKALALDPRRVQKVIEHMVDHFLTHPDPNGFKAQFVTVDRTACSIYKDALDAEFAKRGLPSELSAVIISQGQNDTPDLRRFHYTKDKSDELIDYFKLTPPQWEEWSRKKYGDDRTKWERPPLKILIVCDRLLTGFDAPVEQVMYLDKPLRDHNLLQAMARTNRTLPEMGKRTGVIVDYFGVTENLEKALNFDESVREEALIDWDKLKALIPAEIERCMAFFKGITIADTRDCLMDCLRRLANPNTARDFETQFKRTEVLWEAIAPDACLYDHRKEYAWVTSMYIAHRRRNRRSQATREELAAKTRQLIQDHTTVMDIAEDVPVYKIDGDYLTRVRELPTPSDRAAELEAALTRELTEDGGGFAYKKLGERLKKVIQKKEAGDAAAIRLLEELQELVEEFNTLNSEPERLGLTEPGEFDLFTVIRAFAAVDDEALCVRAAKAMMAQLHSKSQLPAGWSDNDGGRSNVGMALQVASWDKEFESLQLCPPEKADLPFLDAAVDELAEKLD